MKKTIMTISLFLLTTTSHAAIQLKANPEKSEVNFLAVGKPSMLKIRGLATGPTANLKIEKGNLTGTAIFRLDQLDTGIALRNQHMKEKYLHTKEYPSATLKILSANIDQNFEKSLTNSEQPFTGILNLHGKEQNISGTFSSENGLVKAKFSLKVTDFGIEIPSYLGVTVTESVDVFVTLALENEK